MAKTYRFIFRNALLLLLALSLLSPLWAPGRALAGTEAVSKSKKHSVNLSLILPSGSGFAGIPAYPNRKLATRTGPSTKYDEPGTFSVKKSVTAMSKAYDTVNEIWWIQVQFVYSGKRYFAYTGLKRFDGLDINQLPEEQVIGSCYFSTAAEAFYAPSDDAARMKRDIPAGTYCSIIAQVQGTDSDYIQVDFYDPGLGQMRRAWVKEWWADQEVFY